MESRAAAPRVGPRATCAVRSEKPGRRCAESRAAPSTVHGGPGDGTGHGPGTRPAGRAAPARRGPVRRLPPGRGGGRRPCVNRAASPAAPGRLRRRYWREADHSRRRRIPRPARPRGAPRGPRRGPRHPGGAARPGPGPALRRRPGPRPAGGGRPRRPGGHRHHRPRRGRARRRLRVLRHPRRRTGGARRRRTGRPGPRRPRSGDGRRRRYRLRPAHRPRRRRHRAPCGPARPRRLGHQLHQPGGTGHRGHGRVTWATG